MGFVTIKAPDLKAEAGKLIAASKEKLKEIGMEIAATAEEISENQKLRAPTGVDNRLAASLTVQKIDTLHYKVIAGTYYAVYVEFGTRSKVEIPPTPAAQQLYDEGIAIAKKHEGLWQDFEKAIRRWVKFKGIGGLKTKGGKVSKSKKSQKMIDSAVFLIMRKIYNYGVEPQPFFYPEIEKQRKGLDKRIKQILDA